MTNSGIGTNRRETRIQITKCKYNKQNVIYSNEVEKLFFEYDVVMVQGDWTLPNENIRKFLNKYNRYGIPFNIIYSPTIPEGLILPELLSNTGPKIDRYPFRLIIIFIGPNNLTLNEIGITSKLSSSPSTKYWF